MNELRFTYAQASQAAVFGSESLAGAEPKLQKVEVDFIIFQLIVRSKT